MIRVESCLSLLVWLSILMTDKTVRVNPQNRFTVTYLENRISKIKKISRK